MKENVIIGKLIPAGTGMKRYHDVKLNTDYSEDDSVSVSEEEYEFQVEEETLDFVEDDYDTELNPEEDSYEDADEALSEQLDEVIREEELVLSGE